MGGTRVSLDERRAPRRRGGRSDAGATDAEAWVEEATSRRIRVYEGEVESLSDAGGRGVGVRAFVDGRSGYAYGTDLSRRRARPRSPARRARPPRPPTPTSTAACRTSSARRPSRASPRPGCATGRTERKVELALAVERAARSRAGRDAGRERRLLGRRGQRRARQLARLRGRLRRHPGVGLRVGLRRRGRRPDDRPRRRSSARDPERARPRARSAPRRPSARSRWSGARQPESRRCPVVLDAFVAASFIGFIGSMLSAEAVQRGRSLFAGPRGRRDRRRRARARRRRHRPRGPVERALRRRGLADAGAPPLIADGRLLTFLFDARTARRAGRATTGNASRGSYRSPALGGHDATSCSSPATHDLDGLFARGRRRAVRDRRGRPALGGQPGVGHVLRGRVRAPDRGRRAGAARCASSRSPATSCSMLQAVRAVGSEARWVPFGGSVKAPPILVGEMAVSGA